MTGQLLCCAGWYKLPFGRLYKVLIFTPKDGVEQDYPGRGGKTEH
jgi:hypothetical protein